MQYPSHPEPKRPMNLPSISPEELREIATLIDILDLFQPDASYPPISVEPLRLHPSRVQALREHLHESRESMDDPMLERFIEGAFADDLMVESYFLPRSIRATTLPIDQWQEEQLPLDAALRAARRAREAPILTNEHERQLAYAAALVYPCGLFNCLHPWVVKTTGRSDVEFNRAREVTSHLLEWPLQLLRLDHKGMGDTLSEVFERGIDNDVDPASPARCRAPSGPLWASVARSQPDRPKSGRRCSVRG